MSLSVFKKFFVLTLSVMLTRVPQLQAATHLEGQMTPTMVWVNEQSRKDMIEKVSGFLSREDVTTQLSAQGVSASEAKDRVASLSDAELQRLSSEIDNATYGGDGVAAVLIIVLLVVLIVFLVKRI